MKFVAIGMPPEFQERAFFKKMVTAVESATLLTVLRSLVDCSTELAVNEAGHLVFGVDRGTVEIDLQNETVIETFNEKSIAKFLEIANNLDAGVDIEDPNYCLDCGVIHERGITAIDMSQLGEVLTTILAKHGIEASAEVVRVPQTTVSPRRGEA